MVTWNGAADYFTRSGKCTCMDDGLFYFRPVGPSYVPIPDCPNCYGVGSCPIGWAEVGEEEEVYVT